MAQSALIVSVPEADPYVASLRERFDPSARLGVPAHITVLYPFMSPEQMTPAVAARIEGIVAATSAFAFRLTDTGQFPGALYLAPEPAAPFVALTTHLAREFPEFPPYGGQFATVVAHLTVAHGTEEEWGAAPAELRSRLLAAGGIASFCTEVVLIENSSGRWQQMFTFSLASTAGSV